MKGAPNEIDGLLTSVGYKFLGWQNGWETNPPKTDEKGNFRFGGYKDQPEWQACTEAGHKRDEVSKNMRGTENVVSCDICKIYCKYDSGG